MILKGSQRAGGANLANHLLRTDDNEHVELHEVRGFASNDLKEAFKETEAISRGTKCKQYLFSLSLSPPETERMPVSVFMIAIDRAEERLGLQGQPRAVVFHEKEGRRHAHCAWSRIDAETMTAKQMSFYKTKLQSLSRDLYLENGWKMPRGLVNAAERNPTNFTLAEWQQAKRQNIDPRWLKATLQECWNASDGRKAFEHALGEHGFHLARGDKRGYVVVDHSGEVHSLTRMVGAKTREVAGRLGSAEALNSVDATKAALGTTMVPAIRRHVEESRAQFRQRSATLAHYKMEMTHLHRDARSKLDTRHRNEWTDEILARTARLPTGLRGLWHRLTGRYQEVRRQNEDEATRSRERQAEERQKLIEKQLEQRAVLQAQFKDLRKRQAEQLLELRRDVGRFLFFTRGDTGRGLAHGASLGLRLER
ncbi:MAG: relaxase/mobilization nuclease domain-containing protein [Mesorhizobium sp.]